MLKIAKSRHRIIEDRESTCFEKAKYKNKLKPLIANSKLIMKPKIYP